MILAGHGGRSMAAFGAKTTAARGAAWDAIAQQEEQLRIRDATVARVRRQAPAAVAAIVADALAYAICAPEPPPDVTMEGLLAIVTRDDPLPELIK